MPLLLPPKPRQPPPPNQADHPDRLHGMPRMGNSNSVSQPHSGIPAQAASSTQVRSCAAQSAHFGGNPCGTTVHQPRSNPFNGPPTPGQPSVFHCSDGGNAYQTHPTNSDTPQGASTKRKHDGAPSSSPAKKRKETPRKWIHPPSQNMAMTSPVTGRKLANPSLPQETTTSSPTQDHVQHEPRLMGTPVPRSGQNDIHIPPTAEQRIPQGLAYPNRQTLPDGLQILNTAFGGYQLPAVGEQRLPPGLIGRLNTGQQQQYSSHSPSGTTSAPTHGHTMLSPGQQQSRRQHSPHMTPSVHQGYNNASSVQQQYPHDGYHNSPSRQQQSPQVTSSVPRGYRNSSTKYQQSPQATASIPQSYSNPSPRQPHIPPQHTREATTSVSHGSNHAVQGQQRTPLVDKRQATPSITHAHHMPRLGLQTSQPAIPRPTTPAISNTYQKAATNHEIYAQNPPTRAPLGRQSYPGPNRANPGPVVPNAFNISYGSSSTIKIKEPPPPPKPVQKPTAAPGRRSSKSSTPGPTAAPATVIHSKDPPLPAQQAAQPRAASTSTSSTSTIPQPPPGYERTKTRGYVPPVCERKTYIYANKESDSVGEEMARKQRQVELEKVGCERTEFPFALLVAYGSVASLAKASRD